MKIPKRLQMEPTPFRYWMTMLYEVGERVTSAIRDENPYGWTYR